MRPTSSRAWLSPLTGVSFVAIGLSGLLMFFHVRLPGMTALHELGGILFVIVAVLHVRLHWRPLLSCCRQRKGGIALCVATATMALFLALGLGHDEGHHQHRHGPGSAMEATHHGEGGLRK